MSFLASLPQSFSRIRWFNLAVLALTPAFAIYGAFTTKLTYETALLSAFYYFVTMLGTLLFVVYC
jgi:stearoyl-CoA desaturase (delta-9 desaturase)